jgi:hypothetical protein
VHQVLGPRGNVNIQRRSACTRGITALVGLLLLAAGCEGPDRGPVVYYCEGAGWFASAGPVESGLRAAGYKGAFNNFAWGSGLGPAHDHFVNAGNKGIARGLSRRIERLRANDGESPICVMGLSAGTAVVLNAIEQLKDGVMVDNVVLFSPSVSADHNLTRAMRHVRRNLYATCSPHDAIINGLAVNADGKGGAPAGARGFRLLSGASEETRAAYTRVINLPWQPSYIGFDWNGSHTSVTNSEFVANVIAPRVLSREPYPLDRPLVAIIGAKGIEGGL